VIVCESLVDVERSPDDVRAFLRERPAGRAAALFGAWPVGLADDLTFASTAPFPVRVEVALRQFAGGTRVLVRVEAQPGGWFGIPEPVVGTILRRRLAAELVTLREVLEAEPVPVS
jgi:hypothetical protein